MSTLSKNATQMLAIATYLLHLSVHSVFVAVAIFDLPRLQFVVIFAVAKVELDEFVPFFALPVTVAVEKGAALDALMALEWTGGGISRGNEVLMEKVISRKEQD